MNFSFAYISSFLYTETAIKICITTRTYILTKWTASILLVLLASFLFYRCISRTSIVENLYKRFSMCKMFASRIFLYREEDKETKENIFESDKELRRENTFWRRFYDYIGRMKDYVVLLFECLILIYILRAIKLLYNQNIKITLQAIFKRCMNSFLNQNIITLQAIIDRWLSTAKTAFNFVLIKFFKPIKSVIIKYLAPVLFYMHKKIRNNLHTNTKRRKLILAIIFTKTILHVNHRYANNSLTKNQYIDDFYSKLVAHIQDLASDYVEKEKLSGERLNLSPKHPVILIPGIGASCLESWKSSDMSFRANIWGAFDMLKQVFFSRDEWIESLHLNPITGLDLDNIKLRSTDGFSSSDYFLSNFWVWQKILHNFALIGYDNNNMHVAPYDWRLSIKNLEVRDRYFSKLKCMVEMYCKLNGEKVVFITHSLGSVVALNFLAWVGDDFVERHVSSFVNIASPFLGAGKTIPCLLSGESRTTRTFFEEFVSDILIKRKARIRLCNTWWSIRSLFPKGGESIWGRYVLDVDGKKYSTEEAEKLIEREGFLLKFKFFRNKYKNLFAKYKIDNLNAEELIKAYNEYKCNKKNNLNNTKIKNEDGYHKNNYKKNNRNDNYKKKKKNSNNSNNENSYKYNNNNNNNYNDSNDRNDNHKKNNSNNSNRNNDLKKNSNKKNNNNNKYNNNSNNRNYNNNENNKDEIGKFKLTHKGINPLETPLPNAKSMKIYSLYGHGKETARCFYYTKKGKHYFLNIHKNTREIKRGVSFCDGDGTVPVISSGYLGKYGWKTERLNPGNIPSIVREYKHKPNHKKGIRGGIEAADHINILGNYSLIEDISKISCGKGDEVTERIHSQLEEYSPKPEQRKNNDK